MSSSCIIADNAAQFSRMNFPDNIHLRFINFKTEYSLSNTKEKTTSSSSVFPKQLKINQSPIVHLPAYDEIFELIESSVVSYDEVFIILHSKDLNPAYTHVSEILTKVRGRGNIHLIDSQSLSIGQGFLIQTVIELLNKHVDGSLIEQTIRELIPHIYTLLCTPGLSYLQTAGFIDIGQSLVGEMSSVMPVFSLEEGNFTPVEKQKNIHGVIEYFIEYIAEFDDLVQVAFLQPNPNLLSESKLIKQYIEENYPEAVFTEHPHNNYLASLIGPKGFGLVVIEKYRG